MNASVFKGHSGTFCVIACRRNVPATERAELWSPPETMLEQVFLMVKLGFGGMGEGEKNWNGIVESP